MIFKDRKEAGQMLAGEFTPDEWKDSFILAIPRGGVPIGYEISKKHNIPLDVVLVRKLGAPGHDELAFGAIGEEGVKVFDYSLIFSMQIDTEYIKTKIEKERKVIEERKATLRNGKPLPNLAGKLAIIVDDGLATGFTARAAIETVKSKNPKKIYLATPVAPKEVVLDLASQVDDVRTVHTPMDFRSVSLWYEDFPQVTDKEVINIFKKAKKITFSPSQFGSTHL